MNNEKYHYFIGKKINIISKLNCLKFITYYYIITYYLHTIWKLQNTTDHLYLYELYLQILNSNVTHIHYSDLHND